MGGQDDFGGLWAVYKLQVWGLMLDDTAAEPVDERLTNYLTLNFFSASLGKWGIYHNEWIYM